MVGESGKVIAVDVQDKMLKVLRKRAEKAGVADRIITQICEPNSLGISKPIDLCLALYVLHEVPDAAALFSQIKSILKPTGKLLLVEPRGHVSEKAFQTILALAEAASLKFVDEPKIRRSRSALLELG